MKEMKHFLERNSTFGKMLLILAIAFSVAAMIFLGMPMLRNGMLVFSIIPIFPFMLMVAFCIWALRASGKSYDKWWNSLTETQQENYLQDFSNAQQADSFLRLGARYAYIHHIGQPIAYGDIADIDFRRSKNGTTMFVFLRDGKRLATSLPTFTSRTTVTDLLFQRSGNQ